MINSNRIMIRYREEGGLEKDGLIELRRGVEDISIGELNYAKVQFVVDDAYCVKGMAVYSDNMPDGIDIMVNTRKPSGTPKEEVWEYQLKHAEETYYRMYRIIRKI